MAFHVTCQQAAPGRSVCSDSRLMVRSRSGWGWDRLSTRHCDRRGARLTSMLRAIRIGLFTAVIYALNAFLSFVC